MVGVESRYREWTTARIRGNNELEFYWQNAQVDRTILCVVGRFVGANSGSCPGWFTQRRQTQRKTSSTYTGDISVFDDPGLDERLQINRVMDLLGIQSGKNVADIGAGSGWFTVRAARRRSRTSRGRFMRWTSTPRRFITLTNVRKRINS